MICHITTKGAWDAAQGSGSFRSPEFDEIGFIHCSSPEQVVLVANSLFSGRSGLVLLLVDEAKLRSPVRWEAAHSATGRLPPVTQEGFFPHIYGPINLDAVVRTIELVPNEKGNFVLPRPA
jgi:uncharacterized protein (DUF952 family)